MSLDPLGIAAVGAAALYACLLLGERVLLRRRRAALSHVVHVNGTRGKTETTRLVAAAFREAGLPTLAKTTGTEPRLLRPDGTEEVLRRLGAPNVREQRDLLLRARRLGARALVAECMAVSPGPQRASTAFLEPDILVITNVRPDHEAELGNAEETLAVFLEGIPVGGTVITADPAIFEAVSAAAEARGARALLAPPLAGTAARVAANAGLALAVAEAVGIPAETALRGMRACAPDPGAFALRRIPRHDGEVLLVDALAANDPVSTALLFARAPAGSPRILLLANRGDRSDRTRTLLEWILAQPQAWDGLLTTGPLPWFAGRRLRATFPGLDALGRPRVRRLRGPADLALEPAGSLVFACGNWRGLGPALAALERLP
jgi:gamma-polyglutamate synthase